jgi:Integrase core domain
MSREAHVQFWESVGLRCPALLAYLKAYENVAEARQGITAYFEFYNHQRLHQALAYRTPRQVFDEAAPLASSARGKNAGACPTRSAQ